MIGKVSRSKRVSGNSSIQKSVGKSNEFDNLLTGSIKALAVSNEIMDALSEHQRGYIWYQDLKEIWLKEQPSEVFQTVVSHIINVKSGQIVVEAMLFKKFSKLETEKLIRLCNRLNREDTNFSYNMGYGYIPRNMFVIANELVGANPDKLFDNKNILDSSLNRYFEIEKSLKECLKRELPLPELY